MDFIEKVKKFNQIAGNTEEFDSRKLCLYIGLVLEEVDELIEAFDNIKGDSRLANLRSELTECSLWFKTGVFDEMAQFSNSVEVTDAGIDIAIVALGAVMSNGYDVNGCAHEVADSNLSKYLTTNGEHLVKVDENGKIKKGDLYFRPELGKYAN